MIKQYDLTLPKMTLEKAYKEQLKSGTYDAIAEKYRDPGTVYAFQILEGQIIAGHDVKLQAFRHLQDLARVESKQPDFQFNYDLDNCRTVLAFASLCPDPSTGKPQPLALWQKALLCWSQGWRNSSGERRFHRVVFSVARTNGKTYLTVILLSYQYLIASAGYSNQDMAYIAPVSQQSKKGWRYIKTTFNRLQSEGFGDQMRSTKTKIGEDAVKSNTNQNQLLRLSDESGQFDSYHLAFSVHDEAGDDGRIGLIKQNDGKITSGQVQTFDSQSWDISTAYPDATSNLYLTEKLIREAMLKDTERELDDNLLINFTQDNEDEVSQPNTWVKSNPLLPTIGNTMLNSMLAERNTKKSDGSLPEFINKNLNMWLQVKENRFLNPHDIENAVADKVPINTNGHVCYIGIDLSKLSDDTAIALVYPYQANGDTHYYIEQHSWIPLNHTGGSIDSKEKQDGINYRRAEQLGCCDIARNRWGYIDDDSVVTYLGDYIEQNQLQVRFICYDPWASSDVLDKLVQIDKWPMMPIRQTAHDLDKPTHEFQRLMREGRIHYSDDPIIQYSLTNAILVGNSAGLKVDKERYTSKIDCVDAIIDAMSRAIYEFSDVNPDYDPKAKVRDPLSGMSDEERHKFLMNVGF
ncbi:terminase large subunit [Lacticaseibacillus paracasei]|uniref:terminase TerL endonuclease subunit n=1 Tax=Lacticaseibacillus paracasei TaxID=1597 RepID=UPI00263A05EF|nr:terminase TerL endonuclease subunit [Lacticaseibacillus paracasei]MDN4552962.1 terminase large subunit [Lacticaseibacillus paracasei]